MREKEALRKRPISNNLFTLTSHATRMDVDVSANNSFNAITLPFRRERASAKASSDTNDVSSPSVRTISDISLGTLTPYAFSERTMNT